jgi:hypothetical protein
MTFNFNLSYCTALHCTALHCTLHTQRLTIIESPTTDDYDYEDEFSQFSLDSPDPEVRLFAQFVVVAVRAVAQLFNTLLTIL